MTSMRIDGRASAKLWGKRLDKLMGEMEADGVQIECAASITLRKGGESAWVIADSESAE